jgi:hypothetical protein
MQLSSFDISKYSTADTDIIEEKKQPSIAKPSFNPTNTLLAQQKPKEIHKQNPPINPIPIIIPQPIQNTSLNITHAKPQPIQPHPIKAALPTKHDYIQDKRNYDLRRSKIKELKEKSHIIQELNFKFNTLSKEFLSTQIAEIIGIFKRSEGDANELINLCYLTAAEVLNRMESGKESENNEMTMYVIRLVHDLTKLYPSYISFIFEYLRVQCPFLIPYIPTKKTEDIYMAVHHGESKFKVILSLVASIIQYGFPNQIGEIWKILAELANNWREFPLCAVACWMIYDSFNSRQKNATNYLMKIYGKQLKKLFALVLSAKPNADLIENKEYYDKCFKYLQGVVRATS